MTARDSLSTPGKAALAYAKRGWAVFPCEPRGKKPLCVHGLKDASTNEEIIRAWWTRWPDANIGFPTGERVVLDVDGAEGKDELSGLEEKYGGIPDTLCCKTGRGQHLYFTPNGTRIRNSAGKLGPHLDIRAEGGYVILPPSIHASGTQYQWAVKTKPVPLPSWFAELLAEPERTHVSDTGTLVKIQEGQRNAHLTSLAGSMRRRGMSLAAIEAALLEENKSRCDPPLSEGEVKAIAASVGRYQPAAKPGGTVGAEQKPEPLSLADAKLQISQWLSLQPGEDKGIDLAIATVLANEMDGDPLFTILVAASSSAKTEILRGIQGTPSAHFLGSLTARTLASGLDPQRTSLLCQLPEIVHTLVIKDFGSVLAMSPDERGELLQQLRDVYDGLLIRNWGNGKPPVVWKGRLGLLAGATGAIEREFSTLSALGERFLFFRLGKGNRAKQAECALAVAGREEEMRMSISKAMLGALQSARLRLKASTPDCPPETLSALSVLAQVITQCRTPVVRDRYEKTVDIVPNLEGPARAAKALKKLGIALAALHESGTVGGREIALLALVATSNIPSMRLLVIKLLAKADTPLSHKAVGVKLGVPTLTASRLCEDLSLLGIVTRESSTESDAGQFRVSMDHEFRALWEQVSDFSMRYLPSTENADRVSEPEKLNPQNGVGMGESGFLGPGLTALGGQSDTEIL